MICPNCDQSVRNGERLLIGPTKADGFFSIQHVQLGTSYLTKYSKYIELKHCPSVDWYNRLEIDTVI